MALVEAMHEMVPSALADLRSEVAHLSELARTDPITGIANRRALDERLQEEWERARRYGHSLALILVDVDHLKELNDRHGHAAGDDMLNAICCRIAGVLRSSDFFARAGGDEFVILCPEMSPATAAEAAATVATKVVRAAAGAAIADRAEVSASVSAGWATLEGERGADDLMHAADRALYRAKLAGRGRVHGPGEHDRTALA
jgi:diguanylate cyclase (GGDEF)-like protein